MNVPQAEQIPDANDVILLSEERGKPSLDDARNSAPSTRDRAATAARTVATASPFEATVVLPLVLKILGSVIAPTTLLTALLFYFGRMQTTGFFRYLGVNFTVFDFTVQDYLVRSADGLFFPLTVVATTALLALWIRQLLLGDRPIDERRDALRVVLPTSTGAGLALVSVAVIAVVGDVDALVRQPEIGGICFAGGIICLAYAAHLRRLRDETRRRPGPVVVAEWGAVFLLVSVGLFWSVAGYAIGVGTGRAAQLEAELHAMPSAVVYSEKSLNLAGPGIVETVCRNGDAAYGYRYDGLKLVLQSGDQYLFLPATWHRDSGTAVLIPRNENLRLEFGNVSTTPGDC